MSIDLRTVHRLMFKLVQEDECWVWTGATTSAGRGAKYGCMQVKEADGWKRRRVHRVAYEAFCGSIPAELTVDHRCRNTLCCNPLHLTVLTVEENSRQSNEDNPRGWNLPEHMSKENLGF